RCSSIKFVKNYIILSPPEQGEKRLGEIHQIKAPIICAASVVSALAIIASTIGSSSFATEIRAVVVRVCYQLEEHDNTLPLGDTPLLGQYQFSTPEKTAKLKREGGNEKEYGKMKKAEPRTKKGKGEWQKTAEEADVPNKRKKVEGPKKEALSDKQFDHVPLIHLKPLIPKIPKKSFANRVPRKRRVEFPELQNI
ncbi:hypothetical protein GIB67_014775, partial [Kingdonia uniflora]